MKFLSQLQHLKSFGMWALGVHILSTILFKGRPLGKCYQLIHSIAFSAHSSILRLSKAVSTTFVSINKGEKKKKEILLP